MKLEALDCSWYQDRTQINDIYQACVSGARSYGLEAGIVKEPSGEAEILMIWGLGHPEIQELMRATVASGKSVIGWDLGYWARSQKFRVSVNSMHPDKIVMKRKRTMSRDFPELRDTYKEDGHIILVGMGWKSARMYGEKVGEWENRKGKELLQRYLGRKIFFRPKPGNRQHCQNVDGLIQNKGSIEGALNGAALVVCRHSNVAVDALVAGVPFEAEGGAATALGCSPGRLSETLRKRFLANLAWFQWSIQEMRDISTWRTLMQMVEDSK